MHLLLVSQRAAVMIIHVFAKSFLVCLIVIICSNETTHPFMKAAITDYNDHDPFIVICRKCESLNNGVIKTLHQFDPFYLLQTLLYSLCIDGNTSYKHPSPLGVHSAILKLNMMAYFC